MQDAPDLRITRFIVHVVEKDETRAGEETSRPAAGAKPEAGTKLEPSTRETPIDKSFPHDFFKDYIVHALTHELRRRACFKDSQDPDKMIVRTAFQAMLRDEKRCFVSSSEKIARHLHTVMSGRYKHWIKPGDVIVALVESAANGRAQRERWLAILKIDPSDALIREVREEGDERWVVFERREDRLPTFEENKIQKIAVIYDRQRADPDPHDLVLLDNNIKRTDVAHFFYDDFLKTRLNRDAREETQLLVRGFKWVVSQQPLRPKEKRAMVSRLEARLSTGDPVTVQELARLAADAADRPAKEAEKLAADLIRDMTTAYGRPDERLAADQAVPVSAQVAAAQSETRTYILDDVIRVTGPTAVVEQKVEIDSSPGGTITVTIQAASLEIA